DHAPSGPAAPRRIGVLGGAFDPPHIGHVIVAQEAWWRLGLDEVLLVPSGAPVDRPPAAWPAATRLRMVEAAVAEHPGLRASDAEVSRPGPSYTVDTLQAIHEAHPGALLWFMMGADRLPTLPRWRAPERILSLARLAVMPRDDRDSAWIAEVAARVAPGRVDVLETPIVQVSSTMIRARLAAGGPVRYLVPRAVERLLAGPDAIAPGG
ncbi:MAG TPA: nicotinate-nucleotide adenylyltransferase, partial [Miltoncostaeaceae bacterium]|nr:nicotinate-nucleotide adenylyltransferase [Miltoncostaeaceae bacterium]